MTKEKAKAQQPFTMSRGTEDSPMVQSRFVCYLLPMIENEPSWILI